MRSDMTQYAELHCLSNFTFLRGASHPQELVDRAYALGYRALAITDECSVAGVVRAHLAAKACGLPVVLHSRQSLGDMWAVLQSWVSDRRQKQAPPEAAYGVLHSYEGPAETACALIEAGFYKILFGWVGSHAEE